MPDPIARFEGRWFKRGHINILGAGSDQIWTIARDGDGWSLAICAVRHPSVNEKSRTVTRTEFPPTPLEWREDRFDFVNPLHPAVRTRLTVDIVGDRLMLPAIVQRDERTWEFEGWSDRDRFECEHDPRVVPTGGAVCSRPGYPKLPCYYRMTETKSSMRQGALVSCVEFFQIAPDGSEHLCYRLVWEGEPWGTVLRFGETWSGYSGEMWERLSDDKWRAVKALPLVQPP